MKNNRIIYFRVASFFIGAILIFSFLVPFTLLGAIGYILGWGIGQAVTTWIIGR